MKPEHRVRWVNAIMESGLSETKVNKLFDAGYTNVKRLRAATDEELLAIAGIGRAALDKVRAWVGG